MRIRIDIRGCVQSPNIANGELRLNLVSLVPLCTKKIIEIIAIYMNLGAMAAGMAGRFESVARLRQKNTIMSWVLAHPPVRQ
jgi:hypothetical protein